MTDAERIGHTMNHADAVLPISEANPGGSKPRVFRRQWFAHAVWILLALLVFAPTIHWLWQRWTMSVWHNAHGLFIPFVVAYFIYEQLGSDQHVEADQSEWGFLFLILGLGMIVLDSAIRTQLLAAFGMVVCLPGFSLLLLGRRRTQKLAFVWVLAFLMLPIPAAFIERLMLLLRRLSAVGAEQILTLIGVPVVREDTVLFLTRAKLIVGDACSGFSALYASVTLALILAYINPSWTRRVVTLAAAVPIAVACNILRCVLLALIVQRWGIGILGTFWHPASGVLTFAAAAALLGFLGSSDARRPVA